MKTTLSIYNDAVAALRRIGAQHPELTRELDQIRDAVEFCALGDRVEMAYQDRFQELLAADPNAAMEFASWSGRWIVTDENGTRLGERRP